MSNIQKKGRFFLKDDRGKDVFYPWGSPGIGYFISPAEKRKIVTFFYLIGSLFFVTIFSVSFGFRHEKINIHVTSLIYEAIWLIFPLWYGYKSFIWSKQLKKQKTRIRRSPLICYLLFFLTSVHLLTVLAAVSAYSQAPLLVTAIIPLHLIYAMATGFLTVKARQMALKD